MKRKGLVIGAGGLIGSEAARFLLDEGHEVSGVDNNMRSYFFGTKGDTSGVIKEIGKKYLSSFIHHNVDIRNNEAVNNVFKEHGPFDIIIHTAAQPSHDWAVKEPQTDFGVNAVGTINLLEALRQHSPEATFIFTSTNKVYGDAPNDIPMREEDTRWEYDLEAKFERPELKIGVSEKGINEKMTIDQSTHSIFGASKVAADVMVQEYGKYFKLNTGVFRGGCLTGPQHAGVELHGFLSYIIDCAVKGNPYTIFGYKGKQVRDQIHSKDVMNAFWNFHQNPRQGEAYNLGGGKQNSASVLEIIDMLKENQGLILNHSYNPENRIGDHVCYYSDMGKFSSHYSGWKLTKDLPGIVNDIVKEKTN